MTPLLRLQDACFDDTGYGSVEDVDLVVHAGELVVARGGAGTGKTVLARGCAGFVEAVSGEVELFGTPLFGLVHDALLALRARISFASSSAPLLSNQSVRDNVALPLVMRGVDPKEIARVVDDVLARFDLGPVAIVRPEDLLPRDRELALNARALAVPAELFILDDPMLPPAALALLMDRVKAGAGVLAIVRNAALFPNATRVVELRAPR